MLANIPVRPRYSRSTLIELEEAAEALVTLDATK